MTNYALHIVDSNYLDAGYEENSMSIQLYLHRYNFYLQSLLNPNKELTDFDEVK